MSKAEVASYQKRSIGKPKLLSKEFISDEEKEPHSPIFSDDFYSAIDGAEIPQIFHTPFNYEAPVTVDGESVNPGELKRYDVTNKVTVSIYHHPTNLDL